MNRRIISIVAAGLLVLVTCISAFATERSEIDDKYKWKTEHIYANLDEWKADFEAVKGALDELASFKGKFAGENATDPAKALVEFSKLDKEIEIKFEHAFVYVVRNYHVEMSNTDWMGMLQQLQFLGVEYGQKLAWIKPELIQIPQETMHKYIDENPELEGYRKEYDDLYLLQEHVLTEAEEEIMALSGNITGTTNDVFSKMTDVDMDFGYILDENGDSVKVTDSGWVSWRTNKDRRVREDYFKAVWKKYDQFGNTISALMAGNLKKDVYLAKARKFDNTLQAALDNVFIPEQVYSNLINTTRANTKPLHKYNQIRKRMLGYDHYRHWDYYVSLIEAEEERYTWEEGVEMILEALKPLGEDYLKNTAIALNPENGWVDVYTSENKRGGAYMGSCYDVHPYMLYNFDWEKGLTMNDVSTIAHEVGHAMHTWYSEKSQPFPNRDYATFNAEVASTTDEAIFSMKMLDEARAAYKNANKSEKEAAKQHLINLLEQNLSSARTTFFRQTMFATWEWEAHKLAENGQPMTKESFDKLYGELLAEFHGPTAEYEELSNVSWSRIPHFYYGYYVYSYATSYAASIALAMDIRAEAAGDKKKKGATERYLNYLKSGSSKHPVELLADAGVDMTTPQPIEAFIKYFSGMVKELDKLTK